MTIEGVMYKMDTPKKAYARKWYYDHRELCVKRACEWKKKHPAGRREQTRKDYARRREIYLERKRKDYALRPGVYSERHRRWRASHPDGTYKRHVRYYGITPRDYKQLVLDQDGACFLCGEPPDERGLMVDHDHETGVVRGLLCNECNTGLGLYQRFLERFGAERLEKYRKRRALWTALSE